MTIKKSNPITTMLVISMGFLAFYLKFHAHWLIIVSFVVGLIGIFSTYLSSLIDIGWMKLTKLLSYIVPNILLSIVFFVFLFPISLAARLFSKKDNLMLASGRASTFESVNKTFKKETFENPW